MFASTAAPQQPSTFQGLWCRAVASYPDNVFLVFRENSGSVTSWSYADFDDLVEQTAAMMAENGVGHGDAVHVALRNSPAFVLVWLAASRLGAWIVSADPASSANDIALQVQRTGPKMGFCAVDRQDVYKAGTEGIVGSVIALTETQADTEAPSPLLSASSRSVEAGPIQVGPADRLAVMFTSGTTSAPKGVVLTQANYAFTALTMSAIIELDQADRWFVTLPLFHANAQFYCFNSAIAVGASVALTASFSASGWFAQAAQLEVSHASLFAAPIRMILARRPADAPVLALKHLWFAQSLGQAHYRAMQEFTGCTPRQLYGMTETTAIVTGDLSPSPRPDVIGTAALDRQIRLVNPATGLDALPGEPGVITLRGIRGEDLFEGYLNDSVQTDACFSESCGTTWFSTGDLATVDANGVYSFVGRIDDVIKVAGENVSLTEVEAALAQAPGVLEVAVLAKPDPMRDHVPVAFVVPNDSANPPLVEELELCATGNLAPQSRPREWTIIEELPRTSVGKLRRFKLGAPTEATAPSTAAESVGAGI